MATTRKRATSASQASESKSTSTSKSMDTVERIAALAYFKSQARGFSPGHELDDWLEAEQEINGSSSSGKKH